MINKILKMIYNKKEKYVVGTETHEIPTEINAQTAKELFNEQVAKNTKSAIDQILTRVAITAKEGGNNLMMRVSRMDETHKTLILDATYTASLYVYYNVIIHELETRGFKVVLDSPFFTVHW